MDAARIGDHAQVSDSILGRKVVVESTYENPVTIESGSVIGNAVHIRKGCKLIKTKVNYGLTIPPNTTYIDKFLQSYEDIAKLAS
jgi:NDP-sugar pyrophosphorylase family protein